MHGEVVEATVQQITDLAGSVSRAADGQLLAINKEFTVSICIARCQETAAGTLRWQIHFDTSLNPDVVIGVRMDRENQAIQDYYIFPRVELPSPHSRIGEHNGLALDSFRFETLDPLYEMATHVPMESIR